MTETVNTVLIMSRLVLIGFAASPGNVSSSQKEMKRMTDERLYAKDWLNRMYHTVRYIESLACKRQNVLASMSGIGKYDADFIPGGNGENSTETKNLEYSLLSEQIEKEQRKLTKEDIRTLNVILQIDNSPDGQMMKSVLIDRYLSRMSWNKIAEKQGYSQRRLLQLHERALDYAYPYIPKGEIIKDFT